MPHSSLFWADVPGKGRGVFTRDTLPAGTVVEIAPVIVMSAADRAHLDRTLLHDYIFEWNPGGVNGCCMALGWIPLFNHAYASNCEYAMDYAAGTMHIETVQIVKPGTELSINYNGDWNDQTPLWFDAQ